MMFFALLAFLFLMQKRRIISSIAIMASVLIKYATIFLLPLYSWSFIRNLRGKKMKIEQIGFWGFYSMLIIYLLSPLRAELYPWYTVWLIAFAALAIRNRFIFYLSIVISFGVLFRYVPFMLLGTHLGPTPLIKILVTLVPVLIFLFVISIKHLINFKR
jgi:hypothetical protein